MDRPLQPSVLLVEDDDDSRALTAMALERLGYRVVPCANGAEAIDRLGDAFGGGLPYAMVLDWMMPVMTGPEVVAHLIAHPRFASIPVIVVSAVAPLVVARGPVVSALQKPVRMESLRAALEMVSRMNRTDPPRTRSATAS